MKIHEKQTKGCTGCGLSTCCGRSVHVVGCLWSAQVVGYSAGRGYLRVTNTTFRDLRGVFPSRASFIVIRSGRNPSVYSGSAVSMFGWKLSYTWSLRHCKRFGGASTCMHHISQPGWLERCNTYLCVALPLGFRTSGHSQSNVSAQSL